jgi:hypothetical protein
MHRVLLSFAMGVVFWHSLSPISHAQLVQVAPGYVKAPFVRVYTYPDGGSYVRAPFVSVFTRGYRGHGGHPVPTPADCCQMSWRSLSQAVRESSAQLEKDLDHVASGTNWKTPLKTAEIAALVPKDVDAPPPEEVRQQLQEIAKIHSAQNNSPEFRNVANLRSFRVLQVVLAEYASPPEERLRRQLFVAAGDLNRALGRFDTGDTWKQYFTLAPGMALSADKTEVKEPAPSETELAQLLERFDTVQTNEEYSKIARLPAFSTTRERLAAYLAQSPTASSESPEELPAPRPAALR